MEELKNNVKEVENNTTNSIPPKKKSKIKGIIITVICILLLAGAVIGVVLYKDKILSSIAVNKKSVDNNVTLSKIDETKPYVYDMEGNKNKKIILVEKEYNSDKEIKVPYININSEDAKKINEEIKQLYEELYKDFDKPYEDKQLYEELYKDFEKLYEDKNVVQSMTSAEYKVMQNDNILSIVIIKGVAFAYGEGETEIKTYNIDLETGKYASFEQVVAICGLTVDSAREKINKFDSDSRINDMDEGYFRGVDYGKYFINDNKELIIIYSLMVDCWYKNGYNINTEKYVYPESM